MGLERQRKGHQGLEKRAESFRQNMRTQKIWEGLCWTELDERRVLVSGRTGRHSRQRERNVCNPRKTKTRGGEVDVIPREVITETTRLPRQRPERERGGMVGTSA